MSSAEFSDLQHPFVLRRLEPSDYSKGYLNLLEQLTVVGDISEEDFTKSSFVSLCSMLGSSQSEGFGAAGDLHHVVVIEDIERHVIVASATLLVEPKLIRKCGKAGHIEDVVVDQTARGQHLGQRIVSHLTNLSKQLGCYKVILDCSEANAPFYGKCGFELKGRQMARYFGEDPLSVGS
ncbi:hypothetical protein R1sor_020728 [Riccia sorocarpa]|uniref:Glucosamine 6-phosphate N-acetyltransferase n=1 Tax=Riccia sorocarpa TaxID=122646 RepID=A0ABD3GGS8_9MARC